MKMKNDKRYIYCDKETDEKLSELSRQSTFTKIKVLSLIVRNTTYAKILEYFNKERKEGKPNDNT